MKTNLKALSARELLDELYRAHTSGDARHPAKAEILRRLERALVASDVLAEVAELVGFDCRFDVPKDRAIVGRVAELAKTKDLVVPMSLYAEETKKLRTALLLVPAVTRRGLARETPELADCYSATKLLDELDLVESSSRRLVSLGRTGPAFQPPEPRLSEEELARVDRRTAEVLGEPDYEETVEEEAARLCGDEEA